MHDLLRLNECFLHVQRLKTRAQFQAVLAGAIIAKTVHFALHRSRLEGVAADDEAIEFNKAGAAVPLFFHRDMWIGAMVPKRWARRAATRNAIKRQIYAVSRELCSAFPPAAFVVRLRCGFAKIDFPSAVSDPLKQAVRAEIQVLMESGSKAA